MKYLSKEQFFPIVQIIIDSGLISKLQSEGTIMTFLSSIWELRNMKSQDDRFSNLYDDIYKHWVENTNDYDDNNLLFNRLSILDDKHKFYPFLESCTNPKFIQDDDFRLKLLKKINVGIEPFGIKLRLLKYENGKEIYEIAEIGTGMDISDIPQNKIPFYVEKNPTGYSHHYSSHKLPTQFPSFVVVSDDGWGDGYAHIQFNLFFYKSAAEKYSLGLMKITKNNSDMECTHIHPYFVKNDGLPDSFKTLPTEFCSLGQDASYYINLKRLCPDEYMSVFAALRDAAVFSQIDDQFRNTTYYSCLTRDDKAERNIREARLILEGVDIKDRYSFDYKFKPVYSENEVIFHFGFKNPKQLLSHRMFAVIGKNGVGKTQFISTLPKDLSSMSDENFHPRKPLLSKVISFSESNFDNFIQAESNSRLNYIHCGMVKRESDVNVPKSKVELTREILDAYTKIKQYGRINHLRDILESLINKELLTTLFRYTDKKYELLESSLPDVMEKMSSGESIMFYLFCMLEAEMRYDSLVLLDEPETHLHPDAISELICSLDDMLMDYESCCIMVTHSPLLIREIPSDCVYVMDRDDNYTMVRKPDIETIGGNLTVLTDDIFGSRGVQKNYKRRLRESAEKVSYDKLIDSIKSNGLPLGLGIELFIRSLYHNRDREKAE